MFNDLKEALIYHIDLWDNTLNYGDYLLNNGEEICEDYYKAVEELLISLEVARVKIENVIQVWK